MLVRDPRRRGPGPRAKLTTPTRRGSCTGTGRDPGTGPGPITDTGAAAEFTAKSLNSEMGKSLGSIVPGHDPISLRQSVRFTCNLGFKPNALAMAISDTCSYDHNNDSIFM